MIWKVEGGQRLSGEVAAASSKNAVLPQMAAALLTPEALRLTGAPQLSDVAAMGTILQALGCTVKREAGGLTICCQQPSGCALEADMQALRASVLVLGPLLARTGHARAALPGGCPIGRRPIDLHLRGLEAMGARVRCEGGWVEAEGTLKGAQLFLDLPSVGATENLMMAAALAKGTTRIENAAREPEIVDLAACLNAMGARVAGAGGSLIEVEGRPRLGGAEHASIPDRIEVGTLLCAAAAAGGCVRIEGVCPEHLGVVLDKLVRQGLSLRREKRALVARGRAQRCFDLSTGAFPGFPTDLQAPMMVLATLAKGTSVIVENVFENRFMHADELRRMGADIQVSGRTAVIRGGRLSAATVRATDLRAGAALVIAALAAPGESAIEQAQHIDRGYDHLEQKLRALGARVAVLQ